MQAEPQRQHQWLSRLVGDWSFESECLMGPDQPPMKSQGVESVRSLGGLWTIGEGQCEATDPGGMKSIMTLGYDPVSGQFVGTFIASMMSHLWIYTNGTLDANETVLTLDADGPKFTGEGMAKYQDSIEFVNDDHRVLRSRVLGEDGTWVHFMTAHYHRK